MIEALSMLKSIKTEPYPGLRPFQANESHLFFGRDEQVEKLLEKIQNSHFVAVVGPSGCGKSSLVKAGLIPDLKTGFLMDEGRKCRTIEMRPGDKPFDNLARAIHKSYDGSSEIGCIKAELKRGPKGFIEAIISETTPKKEVVLLVVDQFEELFRYKQNNNMDEVIAFIALLIESANHCGDLAIHIVITMRSDFLGECSLFPGLPEILNDNQFLTPRLTRERMKEAIEAPARVCGGMLEPFLVNTLLNDVGVDHDQLPLLQHALMRMWTLAKEDLPKKQTMVDIPVDKMKDMNRKIVINMSHYAEIGKLNQALTQHANQAYDQLDEKQQRIAEIIFRRLSERNAEQKDVRRAATVQEIADVAEVNPSEVIAVADIFCDPAYNFLTSSDENLVPGSLLDISHESIIRQWDKMREWISLKYRSANRYKRLIADSHDQKVETKELLSDLELQNILLWKKRNHINEAWAMRYSDMADYQQVMNYITQSENEKYAAIAREKHKQRKRKTVRYSTVGAFLVLVVAIATISFRSSLAIEEAKAAELKVKSENLEKSIAFERYYSKAKQDSLNNEVEKVRIEGERKKHLDMQIQYAKINEQNIALANKERELVKLTSDLKNQNHELIVKSITSTIWDLPFYSKLDQQDKALAIKELLPLYMKDSTDPKLELFKNDLQTLTDIKENFLFSNIPESYKGLQVIWSNHQTPLINSIITKTLNENLIYKQRDLPPNSGFLDVPMIALASDRSHFALTTDYSNYFGKYENDSLTKDERFKISSNNQAVVLDDSLFHEHFVSSIMYNKDKLLVVEGNGNVIEYRPGSSNILTRFPSMENQMYKISPTGNHLITAPLYIEQNQNQTTKDKYIRIWKMPGSSGSKNIPLDSIYIQNGVRNIVFSPAGDKAIFLFNTDDGKMQVWNLTDITKMYETSRIEAANFSSNGTKLITISKSGTVRYTETNGTTNDYKEILMLPGYDYLSDYTEIKLSPDLKKLLVKTNQQHLLYEREDQQEIFRIRKDGTGFKYKEFAWNAEPATVEFLKDNSLLSVSKSGELYLWNIYPQFQNANAAFAAIKTPPFFNTIYSSDSTDINNLFAQASEAELDSTAKYLQESIRYKDDPDRYLNNLTWSKKIYKKLSELTATDKKTYYEDEVIALNTELNDYDASSMELNYGVAVKLVPRLKENIAIKENRLNRTDSFEVQNLSNDYWNLSWYQLFQEDFEGTIKSVKRGMDLYPANDGMITNLALAYLLSNRYDEAEVLYKKYKGKKYTNQTRYFTTSFSQDLDDMLKAEVIKPTDKQLLQQVVKIREILK